MSGTEGFVEDEIRLFDLLDKLKEGWCWILGGLFVGGFVAATAIFVTPNWYEATAIAQVGQESSIPVEPPSQAVERMKSSAFQFGVAQAIDDQSWVEAFWNGGNLNAITLSSPKGALNLVEMREKGASAEASKRVANVSIEELAKRHAEISKPTVDRLVRSAVFFRGDGGGGSAWQQVRGRLSVGVCVLPT